MRLAKYLATAGVASRRAAERLIQEGRVAVDGETVTDPARAVAHGQRVALDDVPIGPAPAQVVYALHKPRGVVSTAHDPQGRQTVLELVDSTRRLYPVGRLDIDTTGLILLTNDGQLAHRLTHPRFEVPKTYRALVAHPPVREGALRALRRGIELEDGLTAPAQVRQIANGLLELTLREGRKRQVRRMCEAAGHPVKRLERVAIGGLRLGNLKPGSYRRLTDDEVEALLDLSAGATDRRT